MSPGVGADAVAVSDAVAIVVACADEGVTDAPGGDAGVGAHIVLCA